MSSLIKVINHFNENQGRKRKMCIYRVRSALTSLQETDIVRKNMLLSHKLNLVVFERKVILVLTKCVACMYFRKNHCCQITESRKPMKEEASIGLYLFPLSKRKELKVSQASEPVKG